MLARLLSDADVSEFVLYDSYVYVLYVYTHCPSSAQLPATWVISHALVSSLVLLLRGW